MRTDESADGTRGEARAEIRLSGLGVSPGIAIGSAYIGESGDLPVSESRIAEADIDAERNRFAEAVALSRKQLRKLKGKAANLPGSAAEEIGYILDAHLAMLSNWRLVRGVDERIRQARINAERAVQIEIDAIAESFAAMRDSYLAARIDDIRLVGTRLIRNLIKKPYTAYSGVPEGTIILAEELTPADTALMDRALGLPAVLGVTGLLLRARSDATVVIDGDAGVVVLDPAPQTLSAYEARRDALLRARRSLGRLRKLPAVTRDGVEIRLEANIDLPVELDQ